MVDDAYQKRMERKKKALDEKIAGADEDRGLLIVNTGDGKGKSSSAFGMVARALGHGMKVCVVQFIKGNEETGEEVFFSQFENVEFYVMGAGFTWDTQDKEKDIVASKAAWEKAVSILNDPSYDLLVLDEFNIALKLKHLDIDEVLETISNRPQMQHVVITGRYAPKKIIEAADTVTEMKSIKHSYESGVRAQKGIEW